MIKIYGDMYYDKMHLQIHVINTLPNMRINVI